MRHLFGGGDPHTKLHRLWLLQLRPDQVHDLQSQGPPPSNKFSSNDRPQSHLDEAGDISENQSSTAVSAVNDSVGTTELILTLGI